MTLSWPSPVVMPCVWPVALSRLMAFCCAVPRRFFLYFVEREISPAKGMNHESGVNCCWREWYLSMFISLCLTCRRVYKYVHLFDWSTCLFVCLLACLLVACLLVACLLACLLANWLLCCLLVCLFVALLLCLSACLLVCLFVCWLVCWFVCLFVCLLVCLLAHLAFYQSINQSINQNMCISIISYLYPYFHWSQKP